MFNTLPYNSFPASTAKFEEGKNDAIQAEIDAIKDGTSIDSFGDVETALSLKANTSDVNTALATKTNLSNIAPTFDAESGTYDIGEQVIYEGVLYEFTSAHDTPGEWDSSEVQAVKISELIDTLNSNLKSVYGSAYSVDSRTFDSTGIVQYEILQDGFYAIQLQSLVSSPHDLYCTLKVNGTPIVTPFLSQYVIYQYDKISTVIPLKAGAVIYAVGAENDAMLVMQIA